MNVAEDITLHGRNGVAGRHALELVHASLLQRQACSSAEVGVGTIVMWCEQYRLAGSVFKGRVIVFLSSFGDFLSGEV